MIVMRSEKLIKGKPIQDLAPMVHDVTSPGDSFACMIVNVNTPLRAKYPLGTMDRGSSLAALSLSFQNRLFS